MVACFTSWTALASRSYWLRELLGSSLAGALIGHPAVSWVTGLVVVSRLPPAGRSAGALIGHPAVPWMTGLVVASRLPLVGCLAGALIGHPAAPWMTGPVVAFRLPLVGCHCAFFCLFVHALNLQLCCKCISPMGVLHSMGLWSPIRPRAFCTPRAFRAPRRRIIWILYVAGVHRTCFNVHVCA